MCPVGFPQRLCIGFPPSLLYPETLVSVLRFVSVAFTVARAVQAEMINAELMLALSLVSEKNHSFH